MKKIEKLIIEKLIQCFKKIALKSSMIILKNKDVCFIFLYSWKLETFRAYVEI